jgi:hypothetical protein
MEYKEDLLGKSPRGLQGIEEKVIIRYVPDLTAFEQHVENHYASTLDLIQDRDEVIVDFDSYKRYCFGVLRTYVSVQLRPLYLESDTNTERSWYLKSQTLGEDLFVECWLLDVCREICRPMIARNRVLIPVIPPATKGDVGDAPERVSGLGLGVTQSVAVRALLRDGVFRVEESLFERELWEEGVASAPLTMRIDNRQFVPSRASAERRNWWYQLGHFFNGIEAKQMGERVDPLKCADPKGPWKTTVVAVSSIEGKLKHSIRFRFGGTPPPVDGSNRRAVVCSFLSGDTVSLDGRTYLFWNPWIRKQLSGCNCTDKLNRANVLDQHAFSFLRLPNDSSLLETRGNRQRNRYTA